METSLSRLGSLTLLCALVGHNSAAAQTLFFDDFETGTASGWALTGEWHIESASTVCGQLLSPFPSAAYCLRMGSGPGCSFIGADAPPDWDIATMTTPVLLAGPGARAWLRYKSRIDTEACNTFGGAWDLSQVDISTNGGTSWTLLERDCVGNAWHKERTDLSPFLGMNVLLRFSFFTGDDLINGGFGWLIDDVSIRMEPGSAFCNSSNACPCGNYAIDDENIGGCRASSGRQGELYALGEASMSHDSVVLHADYLPLGTTAFVFQGSAALPAPIVAFDGTFCLGGQLVRLGTRMTTTGAISVPSPGGLPLSTVASANTTLYYQVHYRNAVNYCTEGTKNLTNAYSIHWLP